MVAGPSVAAPGICASEGANTARVGNMANQVILPVTQENSASLPSLNPSTAQEFVPRNSSETVTNTLATPVNASNAKSSTFPNLEQYTYPPVNIPVNSNFGAPYPLPNSPPVNTIQQQISGIATALALPVPQVPKFTEESSQNPPDTATSNVISHDSSMVLQAIIPVRLKQRGTNREVLTYALYDPGSTGCFLSEELKDDLQASGVQTNLRLKTMHGESIVKSYLVQDLVVSDINGQNGILLPKTYSRQEIPVSHDQIPRPELLRRWPYLHDVAKSIPEIMPEIDIGLLIGSNCPLAMEPLKIISTDGKGPFALQYRHGWTVSSPVEDNSVTSTHRVNSNRIVTEDIEQATEIISPNRILNILESDFIDSRVARYPGEKGLSPEDTTFLKKAESNVVFKDGHFEIPLPFRNQNLMLPNNKILAMKRALYQKKKMQKDPKYHSDYVNFIDKILQNDYAERIPDSLLTAKSGHVWYLPHHGVYNQRKPDKIRVVFDCSAKFNGISLNDQLLQGPDLTNSLVGVLTRFREHKVAFTCDVESMFYQVKVPKHQ
ncbi:uncharacterized protein [Palaemon carinicauda]|uniref:uncharacterized protein n=1 Tax=Palaemon carinicauda TaxID=392227 RepID=UPI0035B60253